MFERAKVRIRGFASYLVALVTGRNAIVKFDGRRDLEPREASDGPEARHREREPHMKEPSLHPFSSDRPIDSRAQDLLARTPFAETFGKAIGSWRGRDSLVLAINGPWGSGKSSLKNMIVESLSKLVDTPVTVTQFNPWQWAGQDQLLEAFFSEIGAALGNVSSPKEGELAKKWNAYGQVLTLGSQATKILKPLLTLFGIPGAPADILAKVLSQAGNVAKGGADAFDATGATESSEKLKAELREALAELESPIVVILDDIDRLSAQEIKLLFQLVKVNADFPNLVYLLFFQKDIVEKALGEVSPTSGRQYLEKIVQVSVDIPRVEDARLHEILLKGIDEILFADLDAKGFDQRRWGNVFHGGLRHFFQTPRDVGRYLNTLSFHAGVFRRGAILEVNPIDLVALEALRTVAEIISHSWMDATCSSTSAGKRIF